MTGYELMINIHRINNRWVIRKSIKNKRKTYGTYQTINEAQEIRDKLIFHNWNPQFAGLSFKRRGKENKNRYIDVQGGKFRIMKYNPYTGKKEIYDSGIPTLHEAREIRDWWERVGWNWEMI